MCIAQHVTRRCCRTAVPLALQSSRKAQRYEEVRMLIRFLLVLFPLMALAACDPMARHHLSIPHTMHASDISLLVDGDEGLRYKLDAIDSILTGNGLFRVSPHEGAFRTYDSEKEPSESRGSFVYVDILVDPKNSDIDVIYQAFPASPSSGKKLLAGIEEAVRELHSKELQPTAGAPAE